MWIIPYNIVAIICVVAAAVLAIMGKDGWGWFLLVAALTAVLPGSKNVDD